MRIVRPAVDPSDGKAASASINAPMTYSALATRISRWDRARGARVGAHRLRQRLLGRRSRARARLHPPTQHFGDAEHQDRAEQRAADAGRRDRALEVGRVLDGVREVHAGVLGALELRQHEARGADVVPEQQAAERREEEDAEHGAAAVVGLGGVHLSRASGCVASDGASPPRADDLCSSESGLPASFGPVC